MTTDAFFEGLDDAEDVPPSPEPPAPEVAETPAEKPAEKAPEKTETPAEKPQEKAPEVIAEKPAEKPAAPEVRAPESPDPRKWVPVGAHVELRQQMKAMQAELDKIKNPPPAKPEAPDFVQDPKAYVDHRVNAALEQLETGQKAVAQTAEQASAQAAETHFRATLNAAEQHFVLQQPDYYAALAHLRNLRESEIRVLNPEVTQEELGQIVGREELHLAANLLRSNRNPSEVAYNLAKARGYSPKAPPPVETQRQPEPKPIADLLPKVPEPAKLPPDLTLGTGTGSPVTADTEEDPFESAWKEVFGRKRA